MTPCILVDAVKISSFPLIQLTHLTQTKNFFLFLFDFCFQFLLFRTFKIFNNYNATLIIIVPEDKDYLRLRYKLLSIYMYYNYITTTPLLWWISKKRELENILFN